jgi:hypothetical protein
MRTVILSESQVKYVIDNILSEQNMRTESLSVDLGLIWDAGKWKMTSQQITSIDDKLKGISDFIINNTDSTVTIQIESGESQVTNFDREVSGNVNLEPGVLSQRRGEQLIIYLTGFFKRLVSTGTIKKLPVLPKPISKIGSTPYTGPNDLKNPTKQQKYNQEQYVKAIISLKKDYECIVGMEITVGFFPEKGQRHECDEAIFDFRVNGISLGEVNLNNATNDVDPTDPYRQTIKQRFEKLGRESDNKKGGRRSQKFILSSELAKSIIEKGSANNSITLSIVPLVNKGAKYELFFSRGSHADTPWVTIKSKDKETPLYDGEPNVGMSRGSSEETVLLRTDLCGNPIVEKQ